MEQKGTSFHIFSIIELIFYKQRCHGCQLGILGLCIIKALYFQSCTSTITIELCQKVNVALLASYVYYRHCHRSHKQAPQTWLFNLLNSLVFRHLSEGKTMLHFLLTKLPPTRYIIILTKFCQFPCI